MSHWWWLFYSQEGNRCCHHVSTGRSFISNYHPLVNPVSLTQKDKSSRRVLPSSNVREVASSKCMSWVVVNGMQQPDWRREPGVRHSASSSYKAADCYSSTDYSNLDLQQAKGAYVWQAGCCVWFFLSSCCQKWVNGTWKGIKHTTHSQKKMLWGRISDEICDPTW